LRRWLTLPSAKVIADAVACDRPQPRSEAIARPITAKGADVLGNCQENILHEIWSIVFCHAGLSTPPVDYRPVEGHESNPRLRIIRFNSLQQGGGDRTWLLRLTSTWLGPRIHGFSYVWSSAMGTIGISVDTGAEGRGV
jgi:hypothetical protein